MLRTKQIPDPPDSYLENGEAQRGSQPNSLHFHLFPSMVIYKVKLFCTKQKSNKIFNSKMSSQDMI